MKMVVLGAGVVGVCTAWYLAKAGYPVVVVDRQAGPAQETSFANGCQISVSFSEPWASPEAPFKILKWLAQDDAPLLFRPRLEWAQWRWGLAFLRECTPARTARNIRQMYHIAEYSRQMLQQLRLETGLQYDQSQRGILRYFVDPAEFEAARPAAALMQSLGCARQTVTPDEMLRIEPALAAIRHQIVGGDYTSTDESGDVYRFTTQLASLAAEAGVEFRYGTSATRILTEGGQATGVEIVGNNGAYQVLPAAGVVVSLGSFSSELLRPLGVRLNIYPAKGYSATYRIIDPAKAPTVSLTDDARKLVFSRLGDRLRVAGTAELSGHSRTLNPTRCEALTRRTREVFPGACDYDQPQYWSGLRPSTPSNVPYIGRTRIANLYLNTGHGTLGWTMAAGSGKALADLVAGHKPPIDFSFVEGL